MPKSNCAITTDRFILNPLSLAEAPQLAELGADPDVVKTLVFDWSTSSKRLEIAKFWINRNQEFGIWGVYDQQGLFGKSGKMIGFFAADEPLHDIGKGPEIYYAFSRDTWGNGVGTEVVNRVVDHLFEQTGVEVIEALVLPGLNMASDRLLKKLGMELIGRYPFAQYIGAACDPTIDYEIWRVATSDLDNAKQNLQEAAFKIGLFVQDGAASEPAMAERLLQASLENGLAGHQGEDYVNTIIGEFIGLGKMEDGWLYYRVER